MLWGYTGRFGQGQAPARCELRRESQQHMLAVSAAVMRGDSEPLAVFLIAGEVGSRALNHQCCARPGGEQVLFVRNVTWQRGS